MSGNTLNLVLAAAGIVVGGAVSYYFYRITKKERRPVYVVSGYIVVQGDEKLDIEVRYKGHEVPMVSKTVIAFWNAGREPIRRADLLENHPLTVKLPKGTKLLDGRVTATTRSEIDFACFPDERYRGLKLGFSFLNHQDGGAIEILHTSDDPWDVDIEGAIVGVDGPPMAVDPWFLNNVSSWLKIAVSVATILFGLGSIRAAGSIPGDQLWLAFSGSVLAVVGLAGLLTGLRDALRKDRWRVPTALQKVLGWPS
jgi:hypothetical protein